MISEKNPIHRMNEIVRERMELVLKLAPYYNALNLIQEGVPDVDASYLESIPGFREPWEKMTALQREYDNLAMNIAIAWEVRRR
jgi:hypothetical protein